MHRTIHAQIPAPAPDVAAIVSDLGTYLHWLDLVTDVVPADAVESDMGPAWLVTLRAKVGPFARSKRLRMVRTTAEGAADPARFERAETDGRDHAAWTLQATVTRETGTPETGAPEAGSGSAEPREMTAVSMELSYEGRLWSGPLDAILGDQADSAIARLASYATQ